MNTSISGESTSPVRSVDKALVLIKLLAESGPQGAALKDLVAASSFNKASVYRNLQALIHRGFAEQDKQTQNYRLGPAIASLADTYYGDENLPAMFRPLLLDLSHKASELVHLGTLTGSSVLYLDKVEPQRTLRVWSRVGHYAPAATTALGRAILAANKTDDQHLRAYASAREDQEQALKTLRDAVTETRRLGYAAEREENEPGICCVSVALTRPQASPVAVSITGPATRMSPERIRELGNLLRSTLSDAAPAGFRVPSAESLD